MMILLLARLLGAEKYYTFSERIGTLEYTSHGGESVSFYTPMSRMVVLVTRINRNKASLSVASPAQSIPEKASDPLAFDFRYGNSKIVVDFSGASTVAFGFASIPDTVCLTSIDAISGLEFSKSVAIEGRVVDRCWIFAAGSTSLSYRVSENRLVNSMKLSVYHEYLNDDLYSSYDKDGAIDEHFVGDSRTPWLFRVTTSASEMGQGSVRFEGRAVKSVNESELVVFDEPPKTYAKPPVGKVDNKWWIPVLGSIAPAFLLIAWIFTTVKLALKAPVTADSVMP